MMKPTPKQRKELRDCHVGVGMLMMKTGPNEIMYVEVFQARKTGMLCCVKNGQPLEIVLTEEKD